MKTFNEFLTESKIAKDKVPEAVNMVMKDLGLTYGTADSITSMKITGGVRVDAIWVKKGKANVVSKHNDDIYHKLKTSKFTQGKSEGHDSQYGSVTNSIDFTHKDSGCQVTITTRYTAEPSSSNTSTISILYQIGGGQIKATEDEIDRIIRMFP